MTDPHSFRVVVFSRPDDPSELHELLERELGLNQVDAGIAVRHAPGLLPQRWPPEVAERAAQAITHTGLKAVAVAESTIPDLSDAETVHHLRCSEEGLAICNLAGEVDRTWNWDDLQLISVGRVPLERQRHYITDTVTHSRPSPADEYLSGEPLHGLEAWLLFDGPGRILRCDSEHMNYEYLGERKSASGTANFELLIADMTVDAPQAFLTPATRNYLTRGPILNYDFKDSAALKEYTVTEYVLWRELRQM